jgi:predicted DNA-binding transcriptional regulator AlpA
MSRSQNKKSPTQELADVPMLDPILSKAATAMALTLSQVQLMRMVRDERFPRPVYLTPTRLGWRASVVRKWLDALPTAGMPRSPKGCKGHRAEVQLTA